MVIFVGGSGCLWQKQMDLKPDYKRVVGSAKEFIFYIFLDLRIWWIKLALNSR